jgi:hypothetical protein
LPTIRTKGDAVLTQVGLALMAAGGGAFILGFLLLLAGLLRGVLQSM